MCRAIVDADPEIQLCVSTTTRAPRSGEVDGKDYYFLSAEEFECRVAAGEFLEHAAISGHRYGIERRNFLRVSKAGKDLAINIDYVGARTLRESCGEQLVVIYLEPPSLEVLRERIAKRGDTSEELIRKRLELAEIEMVALSDPQLTTYRVINNSLDSALADVRCIIRSERLRLDRFR